jgi:hypothetical protein
MKRYLLTLSTAIFLLVFAFLPKSAVLAIPSFELYPQGGTPYPTVTNINIPSVPTGSTETISADVTDVSGVSSVTAVIKNSLGTQMGSPKIMANLTGSTYVVAVDITGYAKDTYTVDIIAVDYLLNSSAGVAYSPAGTFSVKSNDATLSALAISSGTLSPAFSSGNITYTDSVINTVTSITVTPTANESHATIKVNGSNVNSGSPSGAIALVVGSNTITIIVTAQDNSTKTYTITVTRASASSDATLFNLTITSGTLTPSFSANNTSYTDSVLNTVTSVTVTPTRNQANATIKVNGTTVTSGSPSGAIALVVGSNTITIVVTAQDLTTKTYTIVVTRSAGSNDATLSNLTISSGTLTPTFASATTSYTDSVLNTVTSVTVTPTRNQANATITVNGTAVTSGSPSGAIALVVGSNTITVVVTAQDGTTTKTYTIVVTRLASGDATLSGLTINYGSLNPTFAAATTSYVDNVGNTTSSVSITPTTTQTGSTIKVNGTTAASGSLFGPIALSVGPNIISIVVTAPDAITTKTYTISVFSGSCTTISNSTICLATPAVNTSQINSFTVNGSSSANAAIGDTVALVANLGSGVTGEPVYFRDNTTGAVIGTALTNSSGTASISYTVFGAAMGARTLTAVYNGNQSRGYTASSKQVTLNITSTGTCTNYSNSIICITVPTNNSSQISSFTVNGSSSANAAIGDTVALVANLGSGTVGEPVYFRDDSTGAVIGTALANSSGVASINYKVLGAAMGTRTLTAVYNGNQSRGYIASNKQVTLNITSTGTCTNYSNSIICINNPPSNANQISSFTVSPSTGVTVGTPITLTATFSAGAAAAGEVVQFTDSVAPYNLGNVSVNSSGQAVMNSTATTNGTHTYTVIYKGNPSRGYGASISTVNLTVTGAGSCASYSGSTICIGVPANNANQISSLTVSPSAGVTVGTPIVISATFAAGSAAAGEVVQFTDITTAPNNLGNVVANSSGVAILNYTATTAGTHTYTATYKGNPSRGYGASTNTVNLTVTGAGSCTSYSGSTICIGETASPTHP